MSSSPARPAHNRKSVLYVNYVSHPVFLDVIGTRPDIRMAKLENSTSDAEAESVLADAIAYQIVSARHDLNPRFHLDARLISQMPNLLVASANGAGYDTIDADACTKAGILAVNQSGGNAEAVAEHVVGMMIGLSKRMFEADRVTRTVPNAPRTKFMGRDIRGKTIGIVGLGYVGTRLAEICAKAFDMRVLAFDPYLTAEVIARRGAEKVALDDLLKRSDFVSVNCPRTEETMGMFGAREYALMQPHAYFITTARGLIHDEAALAEALGKGTIAGAGLDVWEDEPPPVDHPLLAFDNVIANPHVAGVSVEGRHTIAKIAAEQLIDILDGKYPPRILNPAVWPHYAERFERILGVRPVGAMEGAA